MRDKVLPPETSKIEIKSQTGSEFKKNAAQKNRFRILHVDDDPCILEISKSILELEGNFEVDTSLSVAEAFEKMQENSYDAIISDYELPQKDGLQFLTQLREQKNEIPFVLFTGKGREEIVVKALNLGADNYINKNCSSEIAYCELADAINKSVERKKSKRLLLIELEEEKTRSDETRKILDGIGDLLFVMDKNRVIIKVNKSACDTFKKKPEELIGKHCFEIVHGTDCPWPECPATNTFETKQSVTKEVTDPTLNIPLLITTSPVLDGQGDVAEVIHIAKDITTIKAAEMELQIAANLFDSASDSILVHDLDGLLVYFNEASYKTRGYTKDEFQALHIRDLELPGNPIFFEARMTDLLNNGEATFETVNLRKDKKILPVEIHARVIESAGRKLVLSIARDISDRKASEEKLNASQEKYETIFESSMDALMLLDEKSLLDCNTSTLRLFGCTSMEELTKNYPADLSPTLQPDGSTSLESAIKHIKKAMWTGEERFFWVHKRTDGTIFPADVLLSRIHLNNRNILQATVRDITKQKKTEEKLKEDSDRIKMMNEKLHIVGGLTRHDVRNKLSVVSGYAYLLKKKHAGETEIVEALGKMEQAAKDIDKIFNFAKMYEQIGVEELIYINAGEKLNEAAELFSGSQPTIMNEIKGLSVLADSFLMQLFYNFIDNTIRYGKKATTIRVHYEKTESGELQLIYEDNGVGISSENKQNLFKEGFSTGGSTGFGLFLTKKMIEFYGWSIQETGKPCEEAKFTITIPKSNKLGKENFLIT
jgi:PAS domain S-box-containing protein